ncbi:hypothetical protein PIB30_050358 [Stylosanthes scabra]|uniref:Uncharacterized protein n=1 Tax=Stylosanthes scabra TaxID=79078 RepID=A0ABU6YGY4_9FABA|nr:hypothetical protein [Stylosanthes scabra]
MGIVSIAGIAEDVVVKIGSLTVPADFNVIRSTRHSKGGTPQVLLARPTLQTAGFKLDYITNASTRFAHLAGLPPFVPTKTSPRSVLRPNKLLVQAIAAVKGEPSPKASAQATVETPSVDIKGKKAARISVKPLRKRFSQRIIARGGPSRPKPKKAVIIDLISDEEGEVQGKETIAEKPPLVATQAEEKEEEEDPEEYPAPYSPLPSFPPSPELGPGEYDDPHYWNYDGHLDQWGTDVVGGEPAATHDWDSTEEKEEDCSTSSDSTN